MIDENKNPDGNGITDPVTSSARELMGVSYLFPYQRLVLANILEAAVSSGIRINWPSGNTGEDTPDLPEVDSGILSGEEQISEDRQCPGKQIVILPTGAGKSLCFQLPALMLDGPSLVIYPILSLMTDQERRLKERGFNPVILRGGQSMEERNEIWKKIESRESRFIIANPEVLLSPRVFEKLESLHIVHLVIDEAHCVSEWGESFRPSYLEIGKIIKAAKVPMVTAFTATASAPVLEKIEKYIFGGEGAHKIIGNPNRINIYYYTKGAILRNLAVKDLILQNQRPAIVFCSSRSGTEKLAHYLREDLNEREIRFYHAGLSREEKNAIESWFFKSPNGILTATCAYGMGVDKANIRTVIHRDCPPSVEAYLQESGRAGRDGFPAKAILLWGPEDEMALKRIPKESDRERLNQLLQYSRDTRFCRREQLLALLNFDGAAEINEAGCCDVCEGTAKEELREEKSVAGFFKRNPNMYTVNEAARILHKTINPQWSEDDVKIVLRFLLKKGSLRINRFILWKGKILSGKRKAPLQHS